MKKLVLVLTFVFAIVSTFVVNANEINGNDVTSKKEQKSENIRTICRYAAITQANMDAEYASPVWQQQYLFYYRACLAELL